jgi:ornithine cyclodeaminase/alanine dehydrogenase-like protein (mu-crystallin family)
VGVVLLLIDEAALIGPLETVGVSTAKMHPSESKILLSVGAGVVKGGGVRTLCESFPIMTIRIIFKRNVRLITEEILSFRVELD